MDYKIFRLFFRNGIALKEVSGESEKVFKKMTAPWEETTLPTILAKYQLKDIFFFFYQGIYLMQMTLVCSAKHFHKIFAPRR